MTNIFKQLGRSLAENYAGRIRTFPNGYKFSDAGTTNAQGVHIPATVEAGKRPRSLALGVISTHVCPSPPGDFPENSRTHGHYWVPMRVCRKCEHHIKRRRGQPYPCCAVLRENKRKGPTPVQSAVSIIETATEGKGHTQMKARRLANLLSADFADNDMTGSKDGDTIDELRHNRNMLLAVVREIILQTDQSVIDAAMTKARCRHRHGDPGTFS